MINIVHTNVHFNDKRTITAVELKLKSFAEDETERLTDHLLVATASAAFHKTTLLTDAGRSLKTVPNPKRRNIVNLIVTFRDDNDLTPHDIANFTEALQSALDNTTII